jgi:3-carboxy-cis,cis-muconate cycloisomerase
LALGAATIAPNLAATLLAALVGEHERAVGAWQAEWVTFPALLLVASGPLRCIVEFSQGVEFDTARMRANLAVTEGQIMAEAAVMALAGQLGRQEAHRLIAEAVRRAANTHRHLHEVLAEDPGVRAYLDAPQIARLFDPLVYQGAAQAFIDRHILAATADDGAA